MNLVKSICLIVVMLLIGTILIALGETSVYQQYIQYNKQHETSNQLHGSTSIMKNSSSMASDWTENTENGKLPSQSVIESSLKIVLPEMIHNEQKKYNGYLDSYNKKRSAYQFACQRYGDFLSLQIQEYSYNRVERTLQAVALRNNPILLVLGAPPTFEKQHPELVSISEFYNSIKNLGFAYRLHELYYVEGVRGFVSSKNDDDNTLVTSEGVTAHYNSAFEQFRIMPTTAKIKEKVKTASEGSDDAVRFGTPNGSVALQSNIAGEATVNVVSPYTNTANATGSVFAIPAGLGKPVYDTLLRCIAHEGKQFKLDRDTVQ